MAQIGALLLSAGMGTRLAPVTKFLPKCLVPIAGKPLLAYWIEILAAQDVNPIVINVHHLQDQVRDFIEKSPHRDRIHVFNEESLLGTGGTLKQVRHLFGDKLVLVAHADNLSLFSLGEFLKAHQSRPASALATMMTFETDAPETCGIVEMNQEGLVVRFHEKVANPPGRLANGAVYLVEPEFVRMVSSIEKDFIDISTEILPHLMGRLFTFHNSIYHRDIGNFASWMQANVEAPLLQNFSRFYPSGHQDFHFSPDVSEQISLLLVEKLNPKVKVHHGLQESYQ